jgi:hypothetical protein
MPKHTDAEKKKKLEEEARKRRKVAIVHQGEAFASQGLGKFAKDVVRVGKWIHPANGREVAFDQARLQRLAENTQSYLANGNKIPYPDGHSLKVKDNMGFWPGPFIVHRDALVAVVEPTDEDAKKGMLDGSIDAVSVYIDTDVVDPKGNKYPEVITHVCATNYPVLTGQGEFLKLDQLAADALESEGMGLDIYFPTALASKIRHPKGDSTDNPDHGAALSKLADAVSSFRKTAPALSLSREENIASAFLGLSRGIKKGGNA